MCVCMLTSCLSGSIYGVYIHGCVFVCVCCVLLNRCWILGSLVLQLLSTLRAPHAFVLLGLRVSSHLIYFLLLVAVRYPCVCLYTSVSRSLYDYSVFFGPCSGCRELFVAVNGYGLWSGTNSFLLFLRLSFVWFTQCAVVEWLLGVRGRGRERENALLSCLQIHHCWMCVPIMCESLIVYGGGGSTWSRFISPRRGFGGMVVWFQNLPHVPCTKPVLADHVKRTGNYVLFPVLFALVTLCPEPKDQALRFIPL